jgi:hypothetical protein
VIEIRDSLSGVPGEYAREETVKRLSVELTTGEMNPDH